jgi:hypothetical protein
MLHHPGTSAVVYKTAAAQQALSVKQKQVLLFSC